MQDLFFPAYEASQRTTGPVTTETTFEVLVGNAINTAIGTSAKSASVSTAAATSNDLQHVALILNANGYQLAQSGSTLTISWI